MDRDKLEEMAGALPGLLTGAFVDQTMRTAAHHGIADALEGIAVALTVSAMIQARALNYTDEEFAGICETARELHGLQ